MNIKLFVLLFILFANVYGLFAQKKKSNSASATPTKNFLVRLDSISKRLNRLSSSLEIHEKKLRNLENGILGETGKKFSSRDTAYGILSLTKTFNIPLKKVGQGDTLISIGKVQVSLDNNGVKEIVLFPYPFDGKVYLSVESIPLQNYWLSETRVFLEGKRDSAFIPLNSFLNFERNSLMVGRVKEDTFTLRPDMQSKTIYFTVNVLNND